MRNYALFEIDAEKIGTALANEGDEVQAEVINRLAFELSLICHGKQEMQICYLSNKLDRHGAEFVKSLAEFVRLREAK